MGGRTSSAAKNRYNAKAYDRITIFAPKGDKDVIKAFAESKGLSTNRFILDAIAEKMKREKGPDAETSEP